MRQFLTIASLFFLLQSANSAAATCDLYVSTSGCDTNPGTEADPFRSIERARDFLRSMAREGMDVTVWIESGEYSLSSTLEFDERDGGLRNGSVTYRAKPGEEVTLSGGVRVSGWTQSDNGIWMASLDRDVKLRSLYVNGRRARMASVMGYATRSGEYKVTANQAPWAWGSGSKPDRSIYTDIPMIHRNQEDVEISNFQLWNCNTICVRQALQEGKKVTLIHQEPYGAIAQTCHWDNFDPGGHHRVANAYEFLREPGQFYFDRADRKLYYIPRPGENLSTSAVIAPRLVRLLRIHGKNPDHPVQNLKFEGIHFAHSDWNLEQVDGSHGRATVQGACHFNVFSMLEIKWHGDMYRNLDVSPGAIECEHCEHIDFIRNRIEHIAAEGISLPNDANHVLIEGNVIRDVAGSGILLGHPQHVFEGDTSEIRLPGGAGVEKEKYPPATERICRNNIVRNNLIKDCTQEFYGEAAISAFFVEGLKVEHNVIENVAFNGVSLGWGWEVMRNVNGKATSTAKNNSISYNRFHGVMQRLNDSGAIYTLGAQPGTEVIGNYIEGVGSPDFPTLKRYGIHHDAGSAFITTRHNVLDISSDIWTVHAFRWGGEHDVTVEDIHTTSLRSAQGGGSNRLSGYHFYPDNVWSLEAYGIIVRSGIEPNFLDILPIGEPPEQDRAFPASVMVQPGSLVPVTPLPHAGSGLILTRDLPSPAKSDALLSIPPGSSSFRAPESDGRYRVSVVDSHGDCQTSKSVLVVKTHGPAIKGVEGGKTYDHPVRVHTEGTGILDDDPTTLGCDFWVIRNGSHQLSAVSANGVTNRVSFTVNFSQVWIDADQGTIVGKVTTTTDQAFPYKLLGPFGANASISYEVPREAHCVRVIYSASENCKLQVMLNGKCVGELDAVGTLSPGVGQIPTFQVAEFPVECTSGSQLTFLSGSKKTEIFLRAIILSD
jgi:Right handed beta helix region